MYALEAEPEKGGRSKRLAIGGVLALSLGVGFVWAANNITPMQKALAKVVPFAIVDVPPPRPKKTEPEPPPPVEQPKPKPQAKPQPQAAATPQPAVPPPPTDAPKPDQPPGPESVGLDADSFGSGGGGPGFHVGTTQMGTPTGRGGGGGGGGTGPVDAPKVGPKIVEAKARAGNREPTYPDAVRKLNIEGLVIVEADIDSHGKVTKAVVRKKLDPRLDEEAVKAVLTWAFEPATQAGQAVASTKFLRFRFQLN